MRRYHAQMDALYLPLMDARRMDAYTALYDAQGACLREAACETLSAEYLDSCRLYPGQPLIIGGDTLDKIEADMPPSKTLIYSPLRHFSSLHWAALAWEKYQAEDFADTAYFEPFYLKPPAINLKKTP